jgi:DNA replication initiation complex subunit (GINS family)
MITYNDLYEALRKERYSEELQKLGKSFLKDVSQYFEDKKTASQKEDDFFSDMAVKNKKKLENAVSIFKEILLRRRRKVLNLAFVASETGISKKDFENLLGFEKELFEEVVKSLERADKNLNESMSATTEKVESKYKLVRFLEDVEEFLGMDGQEIGPFKKREVANLEKELVDILIQDGRAQVLEEE